MSPLTAGQLRGSSAFRNRTSVSRTMPPVSSTSSWLIFCGRMPAGHVGDAGNSQHPHAHVIGHDGFRHGGHAHQVGADGPQIADLRRRFVTRPQHGGVDALGDGDAQFGRHLLGAISRYCARIGFGHVGEARPERIVVGPDQRIRPLQIDVVGDQHQAAALEATG